MVTHFDDYKHRHSEVTFSGDRDFDIESAEVSKKGRNYYHTQTLLGVRTLPLLWRTIFILTNIPYWFVGIEAAYHVATHENQIPIDTREAIWPCFSSLTSAVAILVIATLSTVFHYTQCNIGPEIGCYSPSCYSFSSVNHLKRCDVSGAFIFGAYLFLCAETRKVVGLFIVPLGLLAASIRCKKLRMFRSYAAFHGAWHILGAWALFVVNGLGGKASIWNQTMRWMIK
mmetsp:Transcript_305/g.456  ORF Transcript_305/g.456 Transcript_305/m.456 type:complete len:228 (-) Transcript_305:166-849(-)